MAKPYKAQSALRITCTVGVNITGASVTQLRYKKPSGTTGSWTAQVSDATAGIIYYDLAEPSLIDEAGLWTFWGYITFSDGRSAPGQAVTQYFYNEGT